MATENGTFSYKPTTSGIYTWSFRMKNSGTVAQPASVCYLDNLQVSYPYPYTRIDCDKGPNESYRFGFNGKEKESDLYGDGNAYDFGARVYDGRIGRWLSTDPLEKKYPYVSPYNYVLNTPIQAKDPDGKDVILLVWATDPANNSVGHAAIAISNYKEVKYKVKENGSMVEKSKMVPDGTYTVYDLWPGGEGGADKDNFAKNIPALYNPNKGNIVTKNDLLNSDVSNGEDGRSADGVVQFKTSYNTDQALIQELGLTELVKPYYNGLDNNCSDYAKEAVQFATHKIVNADEQINNEKSITTPNQLYKAAKPLPNAKVLKDDPRKMLDKPSVSEAQKSKRAIKYAEKQQKGTK